LSSATSKYRLLLCILVVCWALLAIGFVRRTSHVAIDGVRYFSIFDDGMISMRYAKNVLQHRGLVWNVGERVEGFTCPLWTLIMVGVVGLFGTHYAPLAMQIFGGVIYLGILLVYYWTALRNKSSGLGLVAGLALLFCSYPISYWALGGMEACAICLTFSIAVGAQYSYENKYIRNPLILHSSLIAISFGLRPDGWLVIAPFFAACWIDSVRVKEYRRALLAPAIVALAVLSVLMARHLYYGEWMPNTYVLKMRGYSLSLRLRNGVSYLRQFYGENLFLFALPAFSAFSAFSKRRVAFLNILAAGISVGYQVYVGGDPWLYWRQLLPVYVAVAFAMMVLFDGMDRVSPVGDEVPFPGSMGRALILIILIAPILLFEYLVHFGVISWIYLQNIVAVYAAAAFLGLALILIAGKKSAWPRASLILIPVTRVLLVVIVGGAIVVGNRRFLPELSGKPFSFAEQAKLIDKAVLATKLFGPGRTHHMAWAGTYPHYVEGTMIDFLGKSDKAIARFPFDESVGWNGMNGMPGHSKYDLRETILNRKPDVIVDYTAWGRQDLSKELKDRYRLIQSGSVSLCVKKELTAGLENLVRGSCPRKLL
jgi:hypothetical protein